jgi:hypothetical protein
VVDCHLLTANYPDSAGIGQSTPEFKIIDLCAAQQYSATSGISQFEVSQIRMSRVRGLHEPPLFDELDHQMHPFRCAIGNASYSLPRRLRRAAFLK